LVRQISIFMSGALQEQKPARPARPGVGEASAREAVENT
jgi:hypothetical protein